MRLPTIEIVHIFLRGNRSIGLWDIDSAKITILGEMVFFQITGEN